MADKKYFQENLDKIFADKETGYPITCREWLQIQEESGFPDSDFEELEELEEE